MFREGMRKSPSQLCDETYAASSAKLDAPKGLHTKGDVADSEKQKRHACLNRNSAVPRHGHPYVTESTSLNVRHLCRQGTLESRVLLLLITRDLRVLLTSLCHKSSKVLLFRFGDGFRFHLHDERPTFVLDDSLDAFNGAL